MNQRGRSRRRQSESPQAGRHDSPRTLSKEHHHGRAQQKGLHPRCWRYRRSGHRGRDGPRGGKRRLEVVVRRPGRRWQSGARRFGRRVRQGREGRQHHRDARRARSADHRQGIGPQAGQAHPALTIAATATTSSSCPAPLAHLVLRFNPPINREHRRCRMSSHREAPEISKDPVADSSDLYAFVSPDKPGYATIIANYVPLQLPDGGPNFFEFGDDVLYEIHISNRGDAQADITYGFRFHTVVFNKNTFLYNTGQITSIFDPHFNRRQYYSVTRTTRGGQVEFLGANLEVPPCNIGPRSTPNYEHLAAQCVHGIGDRTFFAGQRADAFHVDLGSVFDLLDLRPFQNLHVISSPAASGVNSLADLNVHSIAMRVPLSDLTVSGKTPYDPARMDSVVGIWTTASRQRT